MQQPRAYCTYFDSGYLPRGITLIESLRARGDNSPVWILALDDETKSYLGAQEMPHVHTLTLRDLEQREPTLLLARTERSRMEYYFTCTPQLARYVMSQYSDPTTTVIYLDADLYFFDDPQLVLDAMETNSIGIIEHRYPSRLAKRLSQYGRFNVGWVGFRANELGRACLDWWTARCLEWCYDRPEGGKYADQGYLNSFPEFQGVAILEQLGLNLAPWNTGRYRLSVDSSNNVVIDGSEKLVFFHFHGLRRVSQWYVTSQFVYGAGLTKVLRDNVYIPYLRHLERTTQRVANTLGVPRTSPRGNGWRGIVSRLRKRVLDVMAILTGNAIPLRRLREDASAR